MTTVLSVGEKYLDNEEFLKRINALICLFM